MCLPALIPAVIAAGASMAGTAAGVAGTFLGLGATAWSGISMAAGLAGTLMQTIGGIQQGQGQQAMYDANARQQRLEALDARRTGSIEEGRLRQRAKLITGKIHAGQGSSGVVAGEGTGGDILAESAEYGARDAAQARVNAERQAWGLRAQASINRYQGEQAAQAGYSKAGSTFLSGVNTFMQDPWWKTAWQTDPTGPDVDDLVTGMGY